MVNISPFFVLQGSTLRKRKMYEEFLSKVSILGKSVYRHETCYEGVGGHSFVSIVYVYLYECSIVYSVFAREWRVTLFKHQVRESRVQAH